MIFRRAETIAGSEEGQQSSDGTAMGARLTASGENGQIMGAGPLAADNAVSNEVPREQRAKSLSATIRPSQPIDIRGQPRHRTLETAAIRPIVPQHRAAAAHRLVQPPQQHQPKVIQPRRLTASPSVSLDLGRRENDLMTLGHYRERLEHEAIRRRLVSLDQPPQHRLLLQRRNGEQELVDPECPSSSGENNKENRNGQPGMGEREPRLSRSRKRLNSAELDYQDEEHSTAEDKAETAAIREEEQDANAKAQPRMAGADQQPKKLEVDSAPGDERRRAKTMEGGGRIAYLYGVYGSGPVERRQQMLAPYQQLMMAAHHQRSVFSGDGAAAGWCWGEYLCYDWGDECLEELDEGEEPDREDEEATEGGGMRMTRLHTVSDIIGYAKVVRAQRQETLGRLNDVMSELDALIRFRSYSLGIKSGGQQQKEGTTEGGEQTTTTTTMAAGSASPAAGGLASQQQQQIQQTAAN